MTVDLIKPRLTKIIATVGPASNTPQMLKKLFLKGVNVFRLNFSHGDHAGHLANIKNIRALEKEMSIPIAIIADLQGPKLRIGSFAEGMITLKAGAKCTLHLDNIKGDAKNIPLPHQEIFNVMTKGMILMLDDGKTRLKVLTHTPKTAECEVIAGKSLSDKKGVNLPGAILPLSPLTDKDIKDLHFALDHGVDFIALSFVQKPEDIAHAKKIYPKQSQAYCKD